MNNNQNPSDKRKWYRRILSVCLIIAMVNSSILPHFEHIGQVQAEEIDPEEVDAVDAVPEDETPENDNLQEQSEVQPQEAQESQKPQETTADQEQVQPANVLQADNTAQREEQKEKQKADAQQKISPELSVTLTAQTDFPENAVGKINVLEGEGLDNLKKSLNLYLEKDKQELLEVHLPMEIGFVNEAGEEQEKKEQVTVTVTPGEEELYQQLKALNQEEKLLLYHQKKTEEGNEWEKLDYQFYDKTEDAPAYIEFKTESMSPFLFVETTEKQEEEKKEDVEPSTVKEDDKQSEDGKQTEDGKITQYEIAVSGGATKNSDGKFVWKPTDTASGHLFIYDVMYSISGTASSERGALTFELPLHILKDRDGNWADTFECPYIQDSEVQDGDTPDFVYKIDEENNKVIIYNYAENVPSAGYIEIGYSTTKSTYDYVDMGDPGKINSSITVKGTNNTEAKKEANIDPIFIDTQATLGLTQKLANPSYYTSWQSDWGEKPGDADEYYYLVWTIRSSINNNTSPYTFMLEDGFTAMGGSVVGYRFSGQNTYGSENKVENIRWGGTRYDYVLTRYKKQEADEKIKADNSYTLSNKIKATVTPIDRNDPETTANSSQSWTYEPPKKIEYQKPVSMLELYKYGIYGQGSIVQDTDDISDYTLGELIENEKESIDSLKFQTSMGGYPYPETLKDGAEGTEADAEAGKFGQKNVSYEFTDDTLSLEDDALQDDDYDITGIRWKASMRDAVYNTDSKSFNSVPIQEWKDTDQIQILVRTGKKDLADSWKEAAVYDMKKSCYSKTNSELVSKASGENLTFNTGIKGIRLICENAYYSTELEMYPTVSLKRTEHVLDIIGDKTLVRLENQANARMMQGDKDIYNRTQQASDYIKKVTPESEFRKDIVQSKNDKRRKQYVVTWRLSAKEQYKDNSGVHGIRQDSGTFYDLLPAGASFVQDSMEVWASGNKLSNGTYTLSLIENYKNSGRTLVKIQVKEPTTTQYQVSYQTTHDYDAIQDYGRSLLNSAAYETGNDKIADGYEDDGGSVTEKDLMTGLDTNSTGKKFLYTEARHYINILLAGNNGLRKQVKSEKDNEYSSESCVNNGGNYSYRIRVANNKVTRCKNLIFYDSLENYFKSSEETEPTISSDWKGTLKGIDLSNLKEKGIQPTVYLSKFDKLNINNHHDLTEKQDGESVWVDYDTFVKQYGLEKAQAIAVDATKKTDGSDFILEGQKSLVFTIFMKAPEMDNTGKDNPRTYNNVFMQQDLLKGEGTETTSTPQFFHHDYTTLHYRVTGDVLLKKVDQTDGTSPVYGATYQLRGTSDYGTDYEITQTSDKSGKFSFPKIEMGTYELQEVSCTDDWLMNTEVYHVTIDKSGQVTIQNLAKDNEEQYLVKDAPRIHGDLKFKKTDSITGNPINGAEFVLTGTSDYGNDVFQQATSEGKDKGNNENGDVVFKNLELGTYKLSETKTKEGYILSQTEWTVQVDENGNVVLRNEDGTEVEKNSNSVYQIENEPLHSIRFVKSSTYGDNIFLEGAEFSLNGVSDYDTNTEKTGISGSDGIVTIDGLEPGTYQLQETKAPKDHDLNTTIYTVVVKGDGKFTIDGLEKTSIGGTEIYNFKDVRTSGVVKLTKVWKDHKTNAERKKIPDMIISTKKPSKNPKGYTITFDANGGKFADDSETNEMVYSESGSLISGTYYKPNGDSSFIGWYTKEKDGTEYKVKEDGNPVTPLTEDITVYAHYKPPMKYAVAIYGIGVDDVYDEATGNISKGGLTFGPALGENYVQSSKSHEPRETTKLGHAHRCVHDDDWNTIIEWNKKDPYVYEQCIKKGCTHSVEINKNTTTTILSEQFNPVKETGDGPSSLYYELVTNNGDSNCFENLRWHPNGGSYGTNSGGWGTSRIRAMLNGADSMTDIESSSESSDINKSASIYTPENCLLATFPKELQNAIGKRQVKYDFVSNDKSQRNLETTNDKLWFFSTNELADTVSENEYDHPLEGNVYEKYKGTGDGRKGHDSRRVYYIEKIDGNATGYNATLMWLRSVNNDNEYGVLCISGWWNSIVSLYAGSDQGISAGFTLKR